jgi:hypothetical protein
VLCDNANNNDGCIMGYNASGGLTQAAADSRSVGNWKSPSPGAFVSQSASYLVTVTGSTTFTAEYKQGGAGTARFQASSIILQVY